MPRADFYLIDKPRFREEPLLLVCELAKKACAANLPTLVLARDTAQAEALDDLMWSFDAEEYLPHQIAGMDEGDDDTPILIATPDMDIAGVSNGDGKMGMATGRPVGLLSQWLLDRVA